MKGGFDPIVISDEDFKYTIDPDRITWTKNAYNAGLHLFDLVKSIPWETYLFDNYSSMWFQNEDDTFSIKPFKVTAYYPKNHFSPYKLAGGSLYEYINLCQPLHNRNLRQFVDPTGDIDVFMNTPKMESDRKLDPVQCYYEEDGITLNTYMNDLTTWLMRQVQHKINEILFVFDNTEPFDYTETYETQSFADLHVPIGNLWLVRVKNGNMVKIQLLCKYIDCEPDHILEFVFILVRTAEKAAGLSYKKPSSMIINGMHCQTYENLIDDNIDSMTNRIVLHDPELVHVEMGERQPVSFMSGHKWMNHVQRMKWINYNTSIIPPPLLDDSLERIMDYFKFIKTHLSELCKFSYVKRRCLEKNILNELVSKFIELTPRRPPFGFNKMVDFFKSFMHEPVPSSMYGGKTRRLKRKLKTKRVKK
jgi:hypothetical protein